MKKLPFYGYVSNHSVEKFIVALAEAPIKEGVHMVANSDGGDPVAGWGLVVEFREYEGPKRYTVHGSASSTMAYNALYVEDSECIEQSYFVFHRASSYYELEEMRPLVEKINADLRKAVEQKLDVEMFERLAGVDLDRFFDVTQKPVDLLLNAKQAEKIGLIKKVLTLSAEEVKAENRALIAACNGVGGKLIEIEAKKDVKFTSMTKEQLKKEHPAVYASIHGEGVAEATGNQESAITAAVTAEQDRVKSWNVWAEVDPVAVKEGIESGKEITAAQTQEFMLKLGKGNLSASLEDESEGDLDTSEPTTKTEKEQKKSEFTASLRKQVGLNPVEA